MSDLTFDAHVWAHLVRYGAREMLSSMAAEGWQLGRKLRNSGIEIVSGPLVVRTLKSQGADPPHPGGSSARNAFWSQQQTRLPLKIGGVTFPQGANLILDWSVNARREMMLALSKPLGSWNYRSIPNIEWRRHVLIGDGEDLRFDPADEDVDVRPRFDKEELDAEVNGGDE